MVKGGCNPLNPRGGGRGQLPFQGEVGDLTNSVPWHVPVALAQARHSGRSACHADLSQPEPEPISPAEVPLILVQSRPDPHLVTKRKNAAWSAALSSAMTRQKRRTCRSADVYPP
jgi:hypothetical protein